MLYFFGGYEYSLRRWGLDGWEQPIHVGFMHAIEITENGEPMAKYLEGERVYLRTLKKTDIEELDQIMNDWNIQMLTGSVFPITEKGLAEAIERCQTTDSRIWFAIIDKETNKIIGETGFLRIFMPWRTTDYTLEIWDRKYWGKGIGKEVSKLMFEYGFNYLNLHRMAIGVVEKNERAMKFWKSIGFKEEGRQIEGFYSNGEYSDFVMMYILDSDYRKNSLTIAST